MVLILMLFLLVVGAAFIVVFVVEVLVAAVSCDDSEWCGGNFWLRSKGLTGMIH